MNIMFRKIHKYEYTIQYLVFKYIFLIGDQILKLDYFISHLKKCYTPK